MTTRTLQAMGGTLVLMVVGVVALSGSGKAATAHASRGALRGSRVGTPSGAPESGAVSGARPEELIPGPVAGSVEATPRVPGAARAAELFALYCASCRPTEVLPENVREEILAILSGDEATRTAFLKMFWNKDVHGFFRASLVRLIGEIPDADERTKLMEAYKDANPLGEKLKEDAKLVADPARLACFLDSAVSAADRARVVQNLQQESFADPAVRDAVLRLAERDEDEQVRSWSYFRLGRSRVRQAAVTLVRAVSDTTRSLSERKFAVRALVELPDSATAETLLRIFEDGPDEIRSFVVRGLATLPSNRRIDTLLVETLSNASAIENLRLLTAFAIADRIELLPKEEAEQLGYRTADAIRAMDGELAAKVLDRVQPAVASSRGLRDLVQEFGRTANEGSAIRVTIAASPILRGALGAN